MACCPEDLWWDGSICTIPESDVSLFTTNRIYDAIPDSLKQSVEFGKKLVGSLTAGALPMVLLASVALAALSSFTKLDESAKEFRETTGLTNSQMEGIRSQANEITGTFANLGVEAKDVFDTVAGLKGEFSDVAQFSDEVVAGLTVMSKNFGVSAENAAKVQGIFEQVGGLSSETATSLGLQVTQMANLAGVAPAKVMEDIAQSAEIASTLFRGDTIALAKNAIEARRLGTNLQSVASTAEKLLDFESGIGDELVAATFVGGQFNLNRARALAFEGKIVEAQKEVLAQVQRTGDFREKDYFTQQQLAKAAGMSVEEINKQLNAQEKLNSLSAEELKLAEDAINKGLDISNINKEDLANQVAVYSLQQEQQSQLEQLQNSFMGIASTIGSSLTPLLEGLIPIINLISLPIQAVATGFKLIVDYVKDSIPLMITLSSVLAVVYRKQIGTAIASIFSSFAQIPLGLGIPLGIAAVVGMGSMITEYMSKAGDMYSPADGKTVVSTKEGGLFELSPNDDLVAAPGIASKMGGGGTSVGNLGILSAPLNALLTEIKGLRADLNSGKVAVYMDTSKVTSTISRKVDQGTRNNFTLGTT
jgi:transcriptional regulator with XRE-family HTH domain